MRCSLLSILDTSFSRVTRRRKIGSAARVDADELVGVSVPSREEIEECFAPGGLVNRMYPGYEPRSEQVQMAVEVRDALATSTHRADTRPVPALASRSPTSCPWRSSPEEIR